jgi:hypothetical protein
MLDPILRQGNIKEDQMPNHEVYLEIIPITHYIIDHTLAGYYTFFDSGFVVDQIL